MFHPGISGSYGRCHEVVNLNGNDLNYTLKTLMLVPANFFPQCLVLLQISKLILDAVVRANNYSGEP